MFVQKTAILLILLVLPLAATAAPKITFDKQSHDYGKVRSGDTVTEEFTFTNTGDKTLIIDRVDATCGCTKAIKGSSEIPPGGKSKISVEFDTSELKAGTKQKTLYVYSNDPEHSMVKLQLLAEVIKEVNINPAFLRQKLSGTEGSVTFPLTISNESNKPVSITGLKAQPEEMKAALQPEHITVGPHASTAFHVSLKPTREAGRSFYMGRLTFSTDHPTEKKTEASYRIDVENAERH